MMDWSLRPPGGNRTWNAAVLLIMGGLLLFAGGSDGSRLLFGFGGLFFVSGLGLWGRIPWARWTGGISLIAWAGMSVLGMALKKNFRWSTSITMFFLVWIAWQVLSDKEDQAEKKKKDDDAEPKEKQLTSFVLLLSGPRIMTAPLLGSVVARAWGGTYETADDVEADKEGPTWVVGKSPIFLLKSEEAIYMLHNFPKPYTDPQEMAQGASDLRLKKAIEDHRAWMAVDYMHGFVPDRPREGYYLPIARLIAELADDSCLAIYHPESGRINVWDPGLKEALLGPDPLKHFSTPANPPVWNVKEGDREMAAAVAEARRRLPEFVDAFRRQDGGRFSIKAPITAGGTTEHIWIEVDRIEDDRIGGTLGNEPVNLGGMKLGDRVDVAMAEVEDWVFVRDGDPQGLFTAKTLAGRKKPGA